MLAKHNKQAVELCGKNGAPREVIVGMRVIKKLELTFKTRNQKQLGGAKSGGKSFLELL